MVKSHAYPDQASHSRFLTFILNKDIFKGNLPLSHITVAHYVTCMVTLSSRQHHKNNHPAVTILILKTLINRSFFCRNEVTQFYSHTHTYTYYLPIPVWLKHQRAFGDISPRFSLSLWLQVHHSRQSDHLTFLNLKVLSS